MTNVVGKTMLFQEGKFNNLNSYIPVQVLKYCKDGILLVESLDTEKETFEVHHSWLSNPTWANL